MEYIRRTRRRLRRGRYAGLRADVADLRAAVEHLTNLVAALNHDVRSGSLEGLPLFFGYAERFRTDADTMVGVSSVLDRQLARLEECVSSLKEQSRPDA